MWNIGCLQYIANRSRPDIAANVNILSAKVHEQLTVFKYYGSTIGWMSKKQKSVSISTTEAEYYAISLGVAMVCLWIGRIINPQ